MRYLAIGLAAMAMLACRTHMGDDPCDPACDDDHVASFEDCVANGIDAYDGDEACPAGNRRCCALVQHCIGDLDDQTVTNDMVCPNQPTVTIGYCPSDCDASHEARFEECVADGGFGMCFAGDMHIEACCAETIGCLGELGGYLVVSSADCCDTDLDCAGDEQCDLANSQCRSLSDTCGDFFPDVGEDCDEGPSGSASLDCTYGEESCLKCTSECTHVAGDAHYCGDEAIDSLDGEQCDPPGPLCTSQCVRLPLGSCSNRRMDNDETDMDCGGPSCGPCSPGDDCLLDRDCTTTSTGTLCPIAGACAASDRACIEVDACDDGIACTRDFCQAATAGCAAEDPDDDFDDVTVCDGDCDDDDPSIPRAPVACDTIDDDCDGSIDEGTPCP